MSLVASVLTARGMSVNERGGYLQILAALAITAFVAQIGLGLPMISLAKGSLPLAESLLARTRVLVWLVTALGSVACAMWSHGQATDTPRATAVVVLITTPVMVLGSRMLIRTRVVEDFKLLAIGTATTTVIPTLVMAPLLALGELTALTGLLAFWFGQLSVVVIVQIRVWTSPIYQDQPMSTRATAPMAHGWPLIRLGLLDMLAFGPSLVGGRLQLLVIGSALSASAASQFAVSSTVTSPLSLLSATLYSYFAPRYASSSRQSRPSLVRRGARASLLASGGIALASVALAFKFVPTLYGQEYAPSVPPGAVLAVGSVAGIVGLVASLALRLERVYGSVLITSYLPLMVMVVLGIPAARTHGLMGFATVLSAVSVLQAGFLYWLSIRRARTPDIERISPRADG